MRINAKFYFNMEGETIFFCQGIIMEIRQQFYMNTLFGNWAPD